MCFPQMHMVAELVVQASSAAQSTEDVELPWAVATSVSSRAGLNRPGARTEPAGYTWETIQRSGVGQERTG